MGFPASHHSPLPSAYSLAIPGHLCVALSPVQQFIVDQALLRAAYNGDLTGAVAALECGADIEVKRDVRGVWGHVSAASPAKRAYHPLSQRDRASSRLFF